LLAWPPSGDTAQAMSKQNVDLVRGVWATFQSLDNWAAVDWDSEAIKEIVARTYSSDVELRWSTTGPENTVYRGRDGVIKAFREWIEQFSEYCGEPLEFIELEDRVLVPQRHWGVGGASGVPVEVTVTHVYECRGNQIVRVDEYDTLEQARKATKARLSAAARR
jgi:ketosteroid isomerase-like protein